MACVDDPTPCPASRQALTRDTAYVEAGLFTKTRPRRPKSSRLSTRWDPSADIFDDTSVLQFKAGNLNSQYGEFSRNTAALVPETNGRRCSLLAQPPQRLRRDTTQHSQIRSFETSHSCKRKQEYEDRQQVAGKSRETLDASILIIADVHLDNAGTSVGVGLDAVNLSKYRKQARRSSFFIPSEKSAPSRISVGERGSHSGHSKQPLSGVDSLLGLPKLLEENEQLAREPVIRQKNARRSLALAPRRNPLSVKTGQDHVMPTIADAPGCGPGKENVPPGFSTTSLKSTRERNSGFKLSLLEECFGSPPQATKSIGSQASNPTSATNQFRSLQPPRRASLLAERVSSGPDLKIGLKKVRKSHFGGEPPASTRPRNSILPQTASNNELSTLKTSSLNLTAPPPPSTGYNLMTKYPVLKENISNPEMYEEHWLSNQETAISQFLNCIFEHAPNGSEELSSCIKLRDHMLKIYNDNTSSLLYKRLQASLLYGGLSIPHETLNQKVRIKEDLAQRRRFLDLWLKTYDLRLLQAAVEVVTGRQLQPTSRRLEDSRSVSASQSEHAPIQSIEVFLKAFLICNEDSNRRETSAALALNNSIDAISEAHSRGWRHTVLRSLMLILLLDKAYTCSNSSPLLFQSSSPYKSSVAVLQGLSKLLLPSIGDITRVLAHLDYHLQHVQHPLQEYDFTIKNIATDLRDGVILTRLVEILLHSPMKMGIDSRDRSTALQTGNATTSAHSNRDVASWTVSRHLKCPAITRSQKLHNVRIALSALQGAEGLGSVLDALHAEDIVDGHREKTLGLLWALVKGWGLEKLLDCTLIEREIERLSRSSRRKCSSIAFPANMVPAKGAGPSSVQDPERLRGLLQSWSQHIGRNHGVHVSNLSTSFADGSAFSAILAEYEPCMMSRTTAKHSRQSQDSVVEILSRLGCSSSWIALFQGKSSMPSPETVVPQLAFLAWRLLPEATKYHAAVALQCCWRRHAAETAFSKRLKLARVARACAIVVQTREKIVWAAITLQRRWKQVLLARPRHERPP